MNAIVERYDAMAQDYARYWGPVLEETSRRLLDEVSSFVERADGPLRILDVGSGTGALALGAAARWPTSEVIAADAAGAMLDVARERARAASPGSADRLSFVVGAADDLPLPDSSVDLVLSSFVLQLVPDRPAALGEALRVLRPAGRVAYVTWLDRESRVPFRPLEEFDEAVLELGVEEPEFEDEQHAGDVPSPRAAAGELRRAGFRRVSAREDELVYDWTLEQYLEYKLAYDEQALLSILDERQRQRLEDGARRRLERLASSDFRWHAPVVFASGERPAR
jgi:ubiquinone/menaquinone biosynthesis C-methylase UbiE